MSKTPSDKLHRLIRSLSPAEKRYFRIFIKGKPGADTKYVQLFEAMAASDVFDEEKWKTGIYKSQDVEGKKYSELKAYLYDLVLRALQNFDENQSGQMRLNEMLQGVNSLFKRGHYADCRDLLAKARKLAQQLELFAQQIEIIRWEKQLAYTRMDADFLHKNLERLQDEEERTFEKMHNAALYRRAFFQAYSVVKKESIRRGPDRATQLRALMEQPFFVHFEAAKSHTARVLFYRTLSLYYYTSLEHEHFYETGLQLIALLESQPHFLRENLSDYIAALSNHFIACGLLKKYEEAKECLSKMRDIQPITEDDRRKIHRQYFGSFFVLCCFMGEFEEARREVKRCLEEAARFDPQQYETASFYFQFVLVSLGCGDFDEALLYLNEWLAQPRSVSREDLQSIARILSLIIHYELDNFLLLESQLRTATRFLKRKNRFHELENRFMHGMADLLKTPDARGRREVFGKMKRELEALSDIPETKVLLQTFDLAAWLDSKWSGQTFATIVQQKYRKELESTNP